MTQDIGSSLQRVCLFKRDLNSRPLALFHPEERGSSRVVLVLTLASVLFRGLKVGSGYC